LSQRRKAQRQQQSAQAAIQKAAAARDDQLAQLAQRVARLEQQVGVGQLKAEFADAQRRWHEERQRLLDQLEKTGELLRQAQTDLESDRSVSAQQLDQLRARPDPISSDEEEVFARLRAMSLLKESSEMPEENRRIVQSPDDSASPIGQLSRRKADRTVQSSEPHEQEISIEDYMARLLNRARGATPDAYRPVDTALHSSRDRPALRTEPVKMEPRAKAPEASIGLAVMREIANQTARAAITTHHVRHRESRARRMRDFAMVAAAVAAVLLCLADARGLPLFIGGLVAALISVCSFVRAVIRERRSGPLRTEDQEQPDEPKEEASHGPTIQGEASGVAFQACQQLEGCSPIAVAAPL
jgi:hypothetical protein